MHYINHLARSVFPAGRYRSTYIAMFTAYFDASKSEDQRVTTVAGFVSRVSKWVRFDGEWQAILLKANPDVDLFHMTDFVSSKKGWESWKGKTNERRALVEELVSCIKKNINKGFAATVPKRVFDAKNSTHRLSESLGQEYAVCAFACLGNLSKWAETKGIKHTDILCVFEDGDEGQGDMINRLRGWGFNAIPQSKAKTRRFDACDFVAWKARAILDDAIYRKNITDPEVKKLLRSSLDKLDPIIHENGWVTIKALDGICADLKILRR